MWRRGSLRVRISPPRRRRSSARRRASRARARPRSRTRTRASHGRASSSMRTPTVMPAAHRVRPLELNLEATAAPTRVRAAARSAFARPPRRPTGDARTPRARATHDLSLSLVRVRVRGAVTATAALRPPVRFRTGAARQMRTQPLCHQSSGPRPPFRTRGIRTGDARAERAATAPMARLLLSVRRPSPSRRRRRRPQGPRSNESRSLRSSSSRRNCSSSSRSPARRPRHARLRRSPERTEILETETGRERERRSETAGESRQRSPSGPRRARVARAPAPHAATRARRCLRPIAMAPNGEPRGRCGARRESCATSSTASSSSRPPSPSTAFSYASSCALYEYGYVLG